MSLVGNLSICSVCGKRKIIAKQRNKILSKQNSIDVYLECKECAAIPIWDTKTKDGNQEVLIIINKSELRILDWILYKVCKDQQKKLAINL
jgi:hypothetical protein